MTDIQKYLSELSESNRAALQQVIAIVQEVIPDVTEGTAYGVLAFMYKSKPLLAFRVNAKHIGLYPCSGSIISQLKDALSEFSVAAGTVRFTVEHPIPKTVLRHMLQLRQAEIDRKS